MRARARARADWRPNYKSSILCKQPTVEWMSVNDVVDDFDSSSGSSNIGGSEDTPQRRVGVFSYIPSARLVVGAGEPAAKRARKMSAFMPMRGRRDPSADERSSAAADNDNSIPLDFNDASIQHQVSAAEAPARRAAFVRRILARSSAPINEVAVVAPNAGVMQAKLRRAFHPMRGRRSDPQIDALLRELAEINVD